ncbi:MAG TPA: response regulator [Thermoanaerobaculia bacterium]|nr:response regulator [Thermoanaerobaculia bacterium]
MEDNANDLDLAVRALRKHNLANRVLALRDGAAALDFLFARGEYSDRNIDEQPRVIFLDLKLPKVDGIDVLREVKSDPRTRTIPIVIVTSSAEERDRVVSYDLGANSYVVKPIDFHSFTKTMAELGFYWLAVNRAAR